MTLSRKNPRAKQRWTLLAAVVGALTLLVAGLSLGLSSSNFELDKNANHDLTSTHLGGLKTSVDNKTTTTSFVVCELGAAPPTPFEIQIDAERMQVNSIGASATTGGCSFANPLDVATSAHTWNVTRAFDSTSIASHVGGPPRNDVTRIQTASGHD